MNQVVSIHNSPFMSSHLLNDDEQKTQA